MNEKRRRGSSEALGMGEPSTLLGESLFFKPLDDAGHAVVGVEL